MTAAARVANNYAIYTGHAYTVRGAVKLPDGTQLIAIRNPHGNEKYTGPYGDDDPAWNNPANVRAAGKYMSNANDGSWMIPVHDFKRIFSKWDTAAWRDDWKVTNVVQREPVWMVKYKLKASRQTENTFICLE